MHPKEHHLDAIAARPKDPEELLTHLCFGGAKRNRLFMTASQSLYALYVNTRGA